MLASLPEGVTIYAQTPLFTETSTPAKLTTLHDTKPGVWGKLVVMSGALDYVIPGPPEERLRVHQNNVAIIEPEKLHRVALSGSVQFWVEFYR